MAGVDVRLNPKRIVEQEDRNFQGTVTAGATGFLLTELSTNLTYFNLKTGRLPKLRFVGNQVQAAGQTFITFHILMNGAVLPVFPYNSFQQAEGETYNGWARIPFDIALTQGALIQVSADNSDGANAYIANARLRIEYEDL